MTTPDIEPGYVAATRSVGFADRGDRVRIEVSGPDRAKLLHNLSTNEIKRLAPGRGTETFLTNGQGRTLALLLVHAEPERLLVRSDPDTADAILAHLAKFGLFEEAGSLDVSSETAEWHLVGPRAEEVARSLRLPIPATDLGIEAGSIEGRAVTVVREDPTGRPGLTLQASKGDAPYVASTMSAAARACGGAVITPGAFESLRIEAGTPVFGRDVTPANLPQEVGRDARAISFVKGCYLGQETVARLDAMGHVNKILFSAVADSDRIPPPGATLQADGKDVGVVTSSADSPGWSRGVVLGYAKVAHAGPGSKLVATWDEGTVGLTIHARPMLPPLP
jgi:folate-binding protein YgfZ